jgi:hypothetical protein
MIAVHIAWNLDFQIEYFTQISTNYFTISSHQPLAFLPFKEATSEN